MTNALDNPVWHALAGAHRALALGAGGARCYPGDITPFSAIVEPTDRAYADLAALLAGREARLFRPGVEPVPDGWQEVNRIPILQMVASGESPAESTEVVELTADDVPEMIELVQLTKPGPFETRTLSLGLYVGIRQGGRLIAMGGERMRVPGHVELSAIAVHPDARRRGHALAITTHLMRRARQRGEVPFLHVRSDNVAAQLYRRLGFATRREMFFVWRRVKPMV